MLITGLDHYNLRAQRPMLDALRDFYVAVLGLEPGPRPPFQSDGYWLYADGQAIVHLTEAPAREQRPAGGASTFGHIAFACTGVTDFKHRLDTHGINYTCDHVPVAGALQLFLEDPAGNGVELNFAVRPDRRP